MSARFFIDTNIFAYMFDQGAPEKARIASQLVRDAIATQKGIVSYQVVQEFFQVAFRRFATPFTSAEAEQYLTSVFRPLLSVHSSPALYVEALRLRSTYRLPWYDSLILAAALEAKCGHLYSEDFQHGQDFEGVRVRNPFFRNPTE
jgi:predicted nucleic acid-binding protein